MPKRRTRVLPFPQAASTKPLATQDLNDAERLQIEKFLAAQDAVLANANVAADVFMRGVMKVAKLVPENGWVFNRKKMRYEQYPVPAEG